jgi:transcriptional regulator with GAF, ATPase, and Fis domain/Tfp pilus assembly protein PilF
MHYSTENYTTALEYYSKALNSNQISTYPDQFRILLRMSDCHRKKGNCSEARAFLEKARALLDENQSVEDAGKIEYREAYILFEQGSYDEALRIGFNAYRRLKHSSEHNEVADIQILLANCYHRLGLSTEAEDFFNDALSSYRRIEHRAGIAYAYNNLGLLHKNACRWNRAIASLSKSLELAKSLGLTQHLIRVQLNLGVVYLKLRRFPDALSSFTNAANMAERFGDRIKFSKAILMQGRTYVQCGEYAKAEKCIIRVQAMANDLGYGREAALADEYLGELMMARGKYPEALVNLNNGLRKARKIAPEGDLTAELLARLAEVHYHLRNEKKALTLVEEGLEVANNCGEFYEIGYLYRTRGLCLNVQGNLDKAIFNLSTSVEMFDKFGNPYGKTDSERYLARFYVRLRTEKGLLKAKQILSDSVVEANKLDDHQGQILSQVLLASVEQRLGNLDDALLAIYEADRLAEEEQNPKYGKFLRSMRNRIEARMASATTRVVDQFSIFGDIQSASQSREKLVQRLQSTLRLLSEKVGAQGGFIAIPNSSGKRFEVACTEKLSMKEGRAILNSSSTRAYIQNNQHGLVIVDCAREPDLTHAGKAMKSGLGTLVMQGLGFEQEALGLLCLHLAESSSGSPVGQEALNFVAAYSSLLSLSIYELVRNERRDQLKPKHQAKGFESVVTENQAMLKLLNLAERVAHSDATVLLQGETGTGKGLIAYAVHLLSDRRSRKFIHVNCAAMPESLLESELFGHVRGAFTGAIADKEGLLRQAHGGTIFLDEIGKTSLAMQGKLLQFLDSGKVRKVGSNDLLPVDVRVICASKANLLKLCDKGAFLEDFFYRINDFPLTVPPLRDRKEDIALLVYHYIEKISQEMGTSVGPITNESMEQLKNYRWPGNVRELEKAVKRAIILADEGESLDLCHFPPEILDSGNGREKARSQSRTLKELVARIEKAAIHEALKNNRGNKSKTAIELGISYPSLLSKIKLYRLKGY